MDFNSITDIKENGFQGFKTIEELWDDSKCIPKVKGVYFVLNKEFKSSFINPGVGGFFKGKDPNVSIQELEKNYVEDSLIVYIGKAGSPTVKATLHSRLNQYLKFGLGKNSPHQGGRLIWQLKYHKNLTICWKLTPEEDPREVEKTLINEYLLKFNNLPFANLVR